MNTEHYRYFASTFETLSYSAAARQIPISVPGLTKAIRRLESQLGVTLFIQENSGALTPTIYAQKLYNFVQEWDASITKLENTFEGIKSQANHEIRVGFCNGTLELLGTDFLYGFERSYPGIGLVYNEYLDYRCDQALAEQECDVAFCLKPYEKDFITTELFCGTVEFWVNRKNPLSKKEILQFKDFDNQPLAMPGHGFKCYDILLEKCAQESITPGPIYSTIEIFRNFEYALHNQGLGYTNGHIKGLTIFNQNKDDIVCLPVEGWSWSFGFSHLPDHRLSEDEQLFYDYTIRYLKKQKADNYNQGQLAEGAASD